MGYTIIQFFWWTYLIFELNAEIIALEKVILEFAASSPEGWEIAAKGDLDADGPAVEVIWPSLISDLL